MMAWYEDIKALTEKSPEERTQFVRSHSRSLSRSSTHRSVSSDGMVDEEDDEPFSAGSQIDIITPGSKQDSASRRSQPGGRFPSDIQINAQRGLQATRSPSSLSSEAQQQQYEYPSQGGADVIAAASALPGIDVPGASFDQDNSRSPVRPVGYGGNGLRSMAETPSGAYLAQQEAEQDGVNPYTSEPIEHHEQQNTHTQENYFAVPAVVAAQSVRNNEPQSQQPLAAEETTQFTKEAEEYPSRHQVIDTTNITSDANTHNIDVLAAAGFSKSGPTEEADIAPSRSSIDSLATTEVSIVDPRSGRPTGNRTESTNTISNLHIPGEYPKGTKTTGA